MIFVNQIFSVSYIVIFGWMVARSGHTASSPGKHNIPHPNHMKNSILLPVGGLMLLLGPKVCGQGTAQQGSDAISTSLFKFSPTHTAQHYLDNAEIKAFTWPNDTSETAQQELGGESALGFRSNGKLRAAGVSGYSTSLGLRAGYTSGITLKHFVKSNAALEFILGTRWEGYSFSMLYEWHTGSAFGEPQLTWVYGLGARVGNYRGDRYFRNGNGNCKDPNDRRCSGYWSDRNLTAIGILGIGGLEFKFNEIPITLSLDIMPTLYLNYWGGTFFDGSFSIRYVIK